mmetsp:Transcript_32867/g.101913  ORF Transcript_32867/g.101913 Transcript_32867/m.101913 type:complete len:393 (+) Transcript_32867:47-1225(+)
MQARALPLGRRRFHAAAAKAAPARAKAPPRRPPDAGRILCVASCKGGVGKSSISLNLAAAFAQRGQRVGILDLDIYGPSLPSLLPLGDQRLSGTAEGLIRPLVWTAGVPQPLQFMSYGYLKPGEFAAVRGPIVSGIAQQLLTGIAWQGLDTLVIDMPPGTGDVHLTVSQQVPVDAAVMVTTPQQLALVDVEKGIRMFDKVGIPTIAVVENMSYFSCNSCGTRHSVFGEGGGKRLAEQFGIESFHRLPLDPAFNSASAESSEGPMLARAGMADREIVREVHGLAERVDAELGVIAANRGRRTKATAVNNGAAIALSEGGGPARELPARAVRLACRCAHCVDEWTGKLRLDPAKVPEDVVALKVESAGRYAVNIQWSDLHTSIYPFTSLKALAP